jgi:hypothetical protein
MVRSRILHRTYYNFSGPVLLWPHVLRLRPREGHDLRIVASTLDLHPAGTVRWYRDAEDNCVGVATMPGATQHLEITSDVIVEQYPAAPVLAAGFAADPNGAGDAWHGLAKLSPYL